MRLWRISNYADLSGLGGLSFSARWHTRGRPVVYTAEHPAGALSEFLVHLDTAEFPETFQLLTIAAGDDVSAASVEAKDLPPGWLDAPAVTRAIGDRWLAAGHTALLRVPSVLVPGAMNVLINPLHPDSARLRIVHTDRVPLDHRLRR